MKAKGINNAKGNTIKSILSHLSKLKIKENM